MSERPASLQQFERALQESESRLQQVLDNSPALIFAKDRDGRYLFVNREFERSSGRTSSQILGRTDDDVFTARFATRFRYNDLRVLHEERAIEFEESVDFGDGPRTYLAAKFPLFDADGSPYAVCGIATDITVRKQFEDALSSSALAVSTAEDETLYRELVRYLATILGVEVAFVATLDETRSCHMQMLAFYLDGQIRENVNYGLPGTPCETIVGQSFRCYPSGLLQLFPLDEDFRNLGLESYAGYPLNDSSGRSRGLISVASRKPLERPQFIESVLRIFAVRASAEFDRVRAAAELRNSERSYREIFEASEDSIFVLDPHTGALLDVNRCACETYGYSREEFLRLRAGDVSSGVPPFTDVEARHWIEQAQREGSVSFEWRSRHRDGSLHWDEVRLKLAEIGGQTRLLGFSRDITERKQADEALRSSEEQYRAIFNATSDALILWDSQFRRVDVNEAYERTYGWSREDVLGRGYDHPAYSPEYAQPRVQMVRRALAGEACHAELESIRKNGEHFPTEVQAIPFRHRGEPHVLAIARDITERKRAESERHALEAQLRQAQKMEAIGHLTGGIAHDFNNLLTSIMGYVTLATERQAPLGDQRLTGYLAQAQRSCERARDLIQQMLMFSRGQPGSASRVAVDEVVRESLPLVRASLPSGMDLVAEVEKGVPAARLDPLQLEQVLLNLCLNARDAADGTGTLDIGVRETSTEDAVCAGCHAAVRGRFVELCVADHGHGIPPDVLERMFEPFYSTKTVGKGTGMGLAIVHGIVHEHGGHVLVETAPGRGSRFRILFPALLEAGCEAPAPAAGPAGPRETRDALEGSVLVVDDEESVGEFMRELLDTWGIRATYLARPQDALDAVRKDPSQFDVVITDQSMPRMTGVQLARELRAVRSDLPVLLYTGYSDALPRDDQGPPALAAVLKKPVDPAALRGALRSLLTDASRQ
jgi:PAS domain S-box-containing protein